MRDYTELNKMVETGKAKVVKQLVEAAIAEGADPKEILEQGLLPGMSVIGEKFKNNEVYVPEVLIAARAMTKGIEVLRPLLVADGVEAKGTVVIGTVKGDLHDIGKNLVAMMFESAGFEVVDLGVDVPADKFLAAAAEDGVKIVACSALLTTTMPALEATVAALKAAGKDYKIMVGGAPISQEFADKVGADAYTPDAATAAKKAKELVA